MTILLSFLMIWQIQAEPVTLQKVINAARDVAEFQQDITTSHEIYRQSGEVADVNWYPQVNLNGEIGYQTDVPSVPISVPGTSVPEAPKDRYQINMNVRQTIWDGGRTASEKDNLRIERRLRDLDLLKAQDERDRRVRNLYFSILKDRVQLDQLETSTKTLQERLQEVRIAVEQGAALSLRKNQLKAEQISLTQQKQQVQRRLQGHLENLSNLTNLEFSLDQEFELPHQPQKEFLSAESNTKIKYLTEQEQSILHQKKLISSDLKPKVQAFGTVGYANPGLNMFEDEFSEYAVGGISISWKLWDWGKTNRQKEVITRQAKLIQQQKNRASQQIETLIHEIKVAVSALDEIIVEDEEIIQLRKQILDQIESQWKAGAKTSAEYVEALSALQKAKIMRELHYIQQSELTQEMLWITGKAY